MQRIMVYELYSALGRMGEVSVMKAAYAIAKTMRNLKDEAEFFESQRNRLVKKYGKEEDGRLTISMESPNWNTFQKEFNEMATDEVDVDIHQVEDATMEDFMAEGVKAKDYGLAMEYLVKKPDTKENDTPTQ